MASDNKPVVTVDKPKYTVYDSVTARELDDNDRVTCLVPLSTIAAASRGTAGKRKRYYKQTFTVGEYCKAVNAMPEKDRKGVDPRADLVWDAGYPKGSKRSWLKIEHASKG